MKKWITVALSSLFLASLLAIPSGCGSNEATKIEKKAPPVPPGHAKAVQEMNKKPTN